MCQDHGVKPVHRPSQEVPCLDKPDQVGVAAHEWEDPAPLTEDPQILTIHGTRTSIANHLLE